MVKQELIQRSPVRIFEKSIHGGLKTGEIGVIASRKGVGKTAVLVQIALDKLLQGKKVIHVSFTQHTDYVIAWYEDIFAEIAKKKNLENAIEVKNDLVKNRVLMNFNQDGITSDQILRSLRAMIIDGGFKADALIIDGFDFTRSTVERLSAVKKFAADLGLEVWYTCTVQGDDPVFDKRNIPIILKDYVELLDVLVVLEPKSDFIQFSVSKDHTAFNPSALELKLDTKTLLIAEK
jgi:KaiC/GvpD/RAD55 family RecA-like ATPase